MTWPACDHADHVKELEGRAMADGLRGPEVEAQVGRALALERELRGEAPRTTTGKQQGLFGGGR